ncbi:MAG: HD domain-containing phosphohydrolase, partial [Rhodospirillaceae bacterium]
MLLVDCETKRLLDANPQAEALFGRPAGELRTLCVANVHPADRIAEVEQIYIKSIIAPGKFADHEILAVDGRRIPVEISAGTFMADDGRRVVIASFRDISERVTAESAMRRLNWALSAVNRAAMAIATTKTESEMMKQLCEGLTSDVFTVAWVGIAEVDSEQSVTIAAKAGISLDYLDNIRVSWGDNQLGRGPTGTAIRKARTQVDNDHQCDPLFAPWAELAAKHQIHSSMATPLIRGDRTFGALTVYSTEINAFTEEVVRLFEDLAKELVVGLDARAHMLAYQDEARKYLEEKLRYKGVLEQTIAALATTIAKRDPYTAEHQNRVADLAVDVALKLGWDTDRCESVYLAGLVHDIGKINVPSEILNKPGKLLQIEFELVKLHPMTGYEILKGIDFPWKLADITRQHHERLDGSGSGLFNAEVGVLTAAQGPA